MPLPSKTMYVKTIDAAQADQLRDILERQGWKIDAIPYARFRAQKDKTTCVAYESGKLTVQGKGTPDLVEFIIEPQIVKEARFGYEDIMIREDHPDMFEPHAGIDESGKGDFFGPLVIACCYVDGAMADKLLSAGVTDSKAIKSDKKMYDLADLIVATVGHRYAIVRIGPTAYNRMYAKFRNLNRMLAWGHARALEDLLEKVPDCPRALGDQFGPKSQVARALMERGKKIVLDQRPKAESDIAVAAASILARATFVEQMKKLGEKAGMTLPKGASQEVQRVGVEVVKKFGGDALEEYAKLHFQTTNKVRALAGLAPIYGGSAPAAPVIDASAALSDDDSGSDDD